MTVMFFVQGKHVESWYHTDVPRVGERVTLDGGANYRVYDVLRANSEVAQVWLLEIVTFDQPAPASATDEARPLLSGQ